MRTLVVTCVLLLVTCLSALAGCGGRGGQHRASGGGTIDPVVQLSAGTPLGTIAVQSFDGVGVGLGNYQPCCAPPDTNASVGPTQVVQWVNLDYAVFDKTTHVFAGPFAGSSFWTGFSAGNCDRNNDGDVSLREWLGTEEEFRRMDADGDGLISADEAERYDAKMRKK